MTGLTQPWHIILILLIALMLFGGRKLPEIGRSLGTGIREFKDSITSHASTSDGNGSRRGRASVIPIYA